MAASTNKWRITGGKQIADRLKNFRKSLQAKILRQAANAATRVLFTALKSNAPVQSGTYKKSLARKVVVRRGNRVWYGVGHRTGYQATVTFNPAKRRISGQGQMTTKRGGQRTTRKTAGFSRKTGDIGGTVGTLKNSKYGGNGSPALFWTSRGRVFAMPLTQKRWPSKYAHLIEKGTRFSRGHHMLARTRAQAQARADAEFARVVSEAMKAI